MVVERPRFFEGQILAAADLTTAVEHSRGHDARHERHLHDWGIAEGLQLTKENRRDPTSGTPYVEVTLQPGMAVAGTGRQVVVTAPTRLSETLFDQINGAALQPGAFYPVLLRGLDSDPPRPAFSAQACAGNGQPTRVQEAFEVTVGRVGTERDLDRRPAPDVAAGPGPDGDQPWDILVGYVQWNDTIDRFTDALPEAPGHVRRRYVGVRADRVAARGGQLELRPHPDAQAGNAAVVLDGDPAQLVFGVYKSDGTVEPRLTVTAKGDVEATGKLTGALSPLIPGEVRVQSGVATDGTLLPLPPGVTEEQVRGGGVGLHTWVTPHVPPSATPLDAGNDPYDWYRVVECAVDADRRIRCRVRWFDADHSGQPVDLPGATDYLVVITMPSDGASP
jgi:hypothetical protein